MARARRHMVTLARARGDIVRRCRVMVDAITAAAAAPAPAVATDGLRVRARVERVRRMPSSAA